MRCDPGATRNLPPSISSGRPSNECTACFTNFHQYVPAYSPKFSRGWADWNILCHLYLPLMVSLYSGCCSAQNSRDPKASLFDHQHLRIVRCRVFSVFWMWHFLRQLLDGLSVIRDNHKELSTTANDKIKSLTTSDKHGGVYSENRFLFIWILQLLTSWPIKLTAVLASCGTYSCFLFQWPWDRRLCRAFKNASTFWRSPVPAHPALTPRSTYQPSRSREAVCPVSLKWWHMSARGNLPFSQVPSILLFQPGTGQFAQFKIFRFLANVMLAGQRGFQISFQRWNRHRTSCGSPLLNCGWKTICVLAGQQVEINDFCGYQLGLCSVALHWTVTSQLAISLNAQHTDGMKPQKIRPKYWDGHLPWTKQNKKWDSVKKNRSFYWIVKLAVNTFFSDRFSRGVGLHKFHIRICKLQRNLLVSVTLFLSTDRFLGTARFTKPQIAPRTPVPKSPIRKKIFQVKFETGWRNNIPFVLETFWKRKSLWRNTNNYKTTWNVHGFLTSADHHHYRKTSNTTTARVRYKTFLTGQLLGYGRLMSGKP